MAWAWKVLVLPDMQVTFSYRDISGQNQVKRLQGQAGSVIVGRDPALANLVINDSQISRRHCLIVILGGEVLIEDLQSANGTTINEVPLTARQQLSDGDTVALGTVELRVSIGENEEDPLPGQTLAGVEVEKIIGAGSFGQVYTGFQHSLDRRVAVKILDPGIACDEEKRESFLAEARHTARLNHPNLVQVYDICHENGYHFILMELLPGGNMADYLKRHGPIDAEDAARVLIDIGEALAYAEAQRLVHRDVKPDNILVGVNGVHKLADLGIATPIGDDGKAIQDRPFGSAHYCAPEQASGKAIDVRADVYALGATLFHLLTGRTMYQGSTVELVRQHLNAAVPNLTQLVPDVDRELAALLMRMLNKVPEARPNLLVKWSWRPAPSWIVCRALRRGRQRRYRLLVVMMMPKMSL